MSIISCQQLPFGKLETGETITCYELRNASGMSITLMDYGASLHSVKIPDFRGKMHEITLGPLSFKPSLSSNAYSGATRIHAIGQQIPSLNALHKTIWNAESYAQNEQAYVKFSQLGVIHATSVSSLTYEIQIQYTLNGSNELMISSKVKTSIPLPVLITHHPIWNLKGAETLDVTDHILQVWANQYFTINQSELPHATVFDIEQNSAFDFTQPQRIGEQQAKVSELSYEKIGFILNTSPQPTAAMSNHNISARIKTPVSGRILEVYTNEQALRMYLNVTHKKNVQGICLSPLSLINNNVPNYRTVCYKLVW